MKIISTILAITFMMIIQPLFGQDSSKQIIKQGSNKYEYQGKTYNRHQLDFIFKEDPILSESYANAMHKHKVGKRLGYGTLGLIGLGAVAIAMPDTRFCDNCWQTLDVIGALSIFVIAPITGTIGTLKHLQSQGKLKKVINGFNDSQFDTYGRLIEQPNIGLSSSGVGFRVTF